MKVKPLLDAFLSWLEEQNVIEKSKLAKAVRYALNEKKYLYTFLEDGNVPIDNNRAENAIRPFAVGRKNWLFNNTERGAKCSAILYFDHFHSSGKRVGCREVPDRSVLTIAWHNTVAVECLIIPSPRRVIRRGFYFPLGRGVFDAYVKNRHFSANLLKLI